MMKRHLSVFMLAAGSTVYKVCGLLLAMAAAEGALFWLALRNPPAAAVSPWEVYSLEQAFTQSRIPLVCGVCFLLLCALLSLSGGGLRGSRLRYTMGRLSVREEATVFWWAAYNILVFFIFWAAQLVIALLLCRFYTLTTDPQYVTGQTVFLAFYRQKFLHSLLPLGETTRTIRNAALVLSLGMSAACFSFRLRHGRRGVAVVLLAALTVTTFAGKMGTFAGDILIMLAALAVTAGAVANIWEKQHDA